MSETDNTLPLKEEASEKNIKTPEESPDTPDDAPEPSETPGDDTVIISTNTALDGYRLKNFYIASSFQQFTWITFHFTMIFFFTFQLKSIVMVGVFL